MRSLSSRIILIPLLFVLVFSALTLAAPVEVEFWHSMTGSRLEVVEKIAADFNAINPDQQINPILVGTYEEALARFLAAYPINQEPGIIQIYEAGTQAIHDSGMTIPAYQLPEKVGQVWDFGQYVRPIVDYYSKDGNLWSWPFASSSAIIYYNADHFRAAGLDPDKPPTTWDEMHQMGLQLLEAGVVSKVFSTGWPDWIFEQQLGYHNQEYCNNGNGREGYTTAVSWPNDFTDALLTKWGEMAKDNVWTYAGIEYDANGAFQAGELTMLFQSTSSLDGILKTVGDDFEVRTTFQPRLLEFPRGNSLVGGNSLHISNQASQEELEVIMEFFKYLARPEVDIYWHQNTGYFPCTNAALQKLMDQGWFVESPNHLTAFLQILSGKTDSNAVLGMRMGSFVQSREWIRDAVEKVSRGEDQRAAMEYSAEQVNKLIAEYNEFIGL
ncbi:MAG: extracellular solute-binding protein [Firmicutes bacterium]|nr:extracellular solute-binding protein [Bacillota bacterium]